MERETFRKHEIKPLDQGISRRKFLSLAGATIVGISLRGSSFLETLTSEESRSSPEITPVSSPTPTPKKETLTPSSEAQESPLPTPTPERNQYLVGGINFIDEQSPIDIVYPINFDRMEMAKFENLQILLPDKTGENEKIFLSQYGGKVFIYSDIPSGTFVLNLHDGRLLSNLKPLEAEPLRELIEGNLRYPYSKEVIETNLEKIIGFPFSISQKGQTARFVITQAKRMNAEDVKEFLHRPQELSLFLDSIERPENSFLLMACSGRQPGEPNETFPGRFVFVLQYSPLD